MNVRILSTRVAHRTVWHGSRVGSWLLLLLAIGCPKGRVMREPLALRQ